MKSCRKSLVPSQHQSLSEKGMVWMLQLLEELFLVLAPYWTSAIQPESSGKSDVITFAVHRPVYDFNVSSEEHVGWMNTAMSVSLELYALQYQSSLCNSNVALPAHFIKAFQQGRVAAAYKSLKVLSLSYPFTSCLYESARKGTCQVESVVMLWSPFLRELDWDLRFLYHKPKNLQDGNWWVITN